MSRLGKQVHSVFFQKIRRFQFFPFFELSQRISIIPLTEEGPSTKYLVYKQLFDTFKNLLSLSHLIYCIVSRIL